MVSHRDGRKKLEPATEQNHLGAVLIMPRNEKINIPISGLPTRGLPAVLLPTQWVESIGACEVPRRGCNRLTAAIPTRLGGGGGRAGCRIEYRKSAEGHKLAIFQSYLKNGVLR
jgi:hypothetical protein